jgi:hypothetical protein
MKTSKKLNRETKQVIVINMNNTKRGVWNKRRRFGI